MQEEFRFFVRFGEKPVEVGSSAVAKLVLREPTISPRHARIIPDVLGIRIEDHGSEFGTYLNNRPIRSARVRVGDRVRFGNGITYRLETDGLRFEPKAAGVRLMVRQLGLSVSRSSQRPALLEHLKELWTGDYRQSREALSPVLDDVSFSCAPESFVGILGPSGCGKSTLLNCLASYIPPHIGELQFDGQNAFSHLDEYRGLLGHVPQDDLLFRSLTVEENLCFAAELRLSDQVDNVLERVGLTAHRHKRVGILSGGQRKRLSVGIELLRRPRLLLLDEPTSGLDPASEAALMEQFRNLAQQGTTVLCTTHLMDNILLFDQVIVLGVFDGVGRLAYIGPPESLLQHFQCDGYAPLYECLESGRFARISFERDDSTNTVGLAVKDPGPPIPRSAPIVPAPPTSHPPKPPPWQTVVDTLRHQVGIVGRRATQIVVRDRGLLLGLIAQPIVLGLLVAISQYDAEPGQRPFPVIFFAVVIAIWLGLNNSARDLVRERRQYVRERLAGLKPNAYLGAKLLVQAGIGSLQVLLLILTLWLACACTLRLPDSRTLIFNELPTLRVLCSLVLSLLGGVGLGFLVSALAPSEESAVAALPMLIIPQLLLSAVGAGVHQGGNSSERPIQPLLNCLAPGDDGQISPRATLLAATSLVCVSRPAAFMAQVPESTGAWWIDIVHLLLLLLITWVLAVSAFQWAEQRWLRFLGL